MNGAARGLVAIAACALLAGVAGAAAADCLYERSPWRCEADVRGMHLRVWIDDRAVEASDSTRFYDWRYLQSYFRVSCMRCAPRAWGESEYLRTLFALETHDQNFVPLLATTFVPLNFAIVSGTPPEPRPTFGVTGNDSLVLWLRDGRRVVGRTRVDVPDPASKRPQSLRETCSQLARQLGAVTLFTRDELVARATTGSEDSRLRWSDHPCANCCVLPVPNGGRDFAPADVVAAYVVMQGQRIDLVRNMLLPAGHTGPVGGSVPKERR